MLRRLSVFRGGFTRAAAAAVLSLDAANSKLKTQNSELLLLLAALVDKSLLRSGADGRYDMHELVRQHAADRLRADPGEEADARNRHCRYYAAWLRQREGALRGPSQRAVVAEIGAEIDNLRLAGEWAIDQGCLAEIRQAIRPMGWFYEVRGWLSEGAALVRRLVDALDGAGAAEDDSGAERAIALGQALAGLGWFHFRQGRLDQAGDLLRRSVDLLRACDAPQPLADALAYLGFLSCESGQYADARRFLAEGLALSTSAGDRWTAAFCQADLGKVAYQLGEYQEARRLLAERLEAWRALGDPRGQVCTSTALSAANIRVGDYGAARRRLQPALAGRGGQYDPWSLASTLDQFGAIALAQGDYAEADYLFRESLALFRSIDDRWHMAQALNHLGWSSRGLGLVAEARRYFREALDLALASRIPPAALEALVGLARDAAPEPALALLAFVAGAPSGGADVRERARQLFDDLAAKLPPEQVAVARRRGQALTLDAAAGLVREPGPIGLSLGAPLARFATKALA
ncbi:MAG TPA: tetratricopeptide repeat protein [Roseiflexaceae bacterium]